MPIVAQCECGKKYKVGDDRAGTTIRCKACRAVVRVPGGGRNAEVAPRPGRSSSGSGAKRKRNKTRGGMSPAAKGGLAVAGAVIPSVILVGVLYMTGVIGGGAKSDGKKDVARNDRSAPENDAGSEVADAANTTGRDRAELNRPAANPADGRSGGTKPAANNSPEKNPAGSVSVRSKLDLSLPELPPKPLVWLEDAAKAEELPPARKKATALMSTADRLKAAERYAEAEPYYRRAIDADPSWGYPHYQLACNYELWNRDNRSFALFETSIKLGFDDFPTAESDDELGRIRKSPDFKAALVVIRDRYVATSKTKVGQPIAIRPQGTKPADGWPLILHLHGYGDTNLSYLDNAGEWAKLGYVAVAVPGSVPSRAGQYQWAMKSTKQTHRDLQAIVKSSLLDDLVDRKKVFLLGFSQGALHAMLLTAEHPDLYAGVIALSPGGSIAERLATPRLRRAGRSTRIVFIHGTQEPHAPLVRIWKDACRGAGWRFVSRTHSGGHHFPETWDQMRPGLAGFLKR